MKHVIPALLASICFAFLGACSQSYIARDGARPSSSYGYSQEDISALEAKLKNTKFPQREGYVKTLLKNNERGPRNFFSVKVADDIY